MGIQNLQAFIAANCPNACVPVDLLKISRGLAVGRRQGGSGQNRVPDNRLCLVIDGECCLDRLYGGFYSDWACGGQWNRMLQFLSVLVQTIHTNNIEIVLFFNGCLEPQRMSEWVKQQTADRRKINQIMKHINIRATPPPKVWWLPPVCLKSCLRMALRHLNVPVVCSMDDHHQEVIAYCRENYFHGIVAEDAEYAIFDPPRYFSSEQLKLTYKGSLETKEFILAEVAKGLNLNPKRFCILAALLGNHLLNDEDLSVFYQSLAEGSNKHLSSDTLIKAVITFIRALPSIDNLDVIGAQVFGSPTNSSVTQDRIQRFKECIQYYLNGTKDGFLRYRPPAHLGRRYDLTNQIHANMSHAERKQTQQPKITIKQKETTSRDNNQVHSNAIDTNPSEAAKFASETEENEILSLSAYKEATVAAPAPAPEIVIEPPNTHSQEKSSNKETSDCPEQKSKPDNLRSNGSNLLSSSTSSSSSDSSPSRVSPDVSTWKGQHTQKKVVNLDNVTSSVNVKAKLKPIKLPKIPPEVMRTASERHQKGLMSPWIYQILTQGEIKIPVALEEETPKELPSGVLLYRPLRQMVYAILFNIHHMMFMAKSKGESEETSPNPSEIVNRMLRCWCEDQHGEVPDSGTCEEACPESSTNSVPEIVIKEWAWSKTNPYKMPDVVHALQLDWGVPTVQRLWFGSIVDDKRRRMRAFLTCLRSDTPLMLKTANVPQHLLILCCVLRYMLSDKGMRVLRKQELDAFIAQAVSPQLMDAQGIQLMQLPLVTNRGIQLASLFMQGVEHALLANDACGAPIPLLMCCVWLFFDGKLFHEKLLKAQTAKNLSDICDGQVDQVVKVERMRAAILDGLNVQFARPLMGMMGGGHFGNIPPAVPVPPPPPSSVNSISRGRGKKMFARGGQLEIAGVVVGSWGANYGQVPARGRSLPMPPSMPAPRRPGGLNMGRGYQPSGYPARYMQSHSMNSARGRRPGASYYNKPSKQTNRKKNNTKADKSSKNNSQNRLPAGRGCTLETSKDSQSDEEVPPKGANTIAAVQNGHAGAGDSNKFDDAVENGPSSQVSSPDDKLPVKKESVHNDENGVSTAAVAAAE